MLEKGARAQSGWEKRYDTSFVSMMFSFLATCVIRPSVHKNDTYVMR